MDPRPPKNSKRLRWLLAPLALLTVIELVGNVAGTGIAGRQHARAAAIASVGQDIRFVDPSFAQYKSHPQEGWILDPKLPGVNNQGFPGKIPSYPYRKGQKEFVIGLFGGGMALDLMGAKPPLAERLSAVLRQRGYDRVTVLPFALNGWRAPQSFAAFISALPYVDMVISLDGFSEVNLLRGQDLRNHPASFPWTLALQGMADAARPATVLRRAKILLYIEDAHSITAQLSSPWLTWSWLAHAYWGHRIENDRAELATLRQEEADAVDAAWAGLDDANTDEEVDRNRNEFLQQWASLIRYSQWICEHQHKPFFHFVQPNLHVPGSKPLSAEEAKLDAQTKQPGAFSYSHIQPLYARLKALSAQLAKEGVDTTYLGDVFKSTSETVYTDDCCNVNEHGIGIVAQAIVDQVVASRQLDRLTRAE